MSAKILINTTKVNTIIEEFEQERSSLAKLRSSVGNIRSNCGISGSQKAAIERSLTSVMTSMEKQSASLGTMGSTLSSIVTLYKNTESSLSGEAETGAVSTGSTGGSGSGSGDTEDGGFEIDWSTIWKLLASGGLIGGTVGTIGSIFTGDGDASSWVSTLKLLVKSVGAAAGWIGEDGYTYLLGMNNALKNIDTSSFVSMVSSSWAKQFSSDLDLAGAATTADKVKVITKWGGYILTGISNIISNYEEYTDGDNSALRAFAETIIETGVDIGLGAGATAAATGIVGMIATAAGLTAAPAIAVGAVSVGIVWGANAFWEHFTGKDIGEWISDGVCDFTESAYNWVSGTVEKVVDTVENTVEAVTSAVSTVGDWALGWLGF